MGTDAQQKFRLPLALATYVAWVLVTVYGGKWLNGGEDTSLRETVSHGVIWNVAVAGALLLVVIGLARWRDLMLGPPQPWSSLRLLWLPALYLVVFFGLAVVLGLPPWPVLMFFFINTLFVGFSEEMMFRGVLFQALRSRVSLWPAIIVTTLLFGSVHILNVFITGKLGDAVIQAITAAMSGLAFMALLIRTRSLWVPIICHALWDFSTFTMSGASGDGANESITGLAIFIPMLLVLPNFLYGLYLLRKVRNDTVIEAAPAAG
jgi:membrane protease YdiL (CAAX protease family)